VVSANRRIVAVEEHFTFPDILDRIDSATLTRNGWPVPGTPVFQAINNGTAGLGPARTLCSLCPSADENSSGCGRRVGARRGLKGALISGTIDGKFLDAAEFEPVLACAERLDVPLYIHPAVPPEGVRAAYYDGLPGTASFMLAIAGWGRHAETAVNILRLALSGALDQHPRLKLLIGHMGEGLPTMMERVERVFGGNSKSYLQRNAARAIADQVWV
jgi:hypothetical protein